MEITQEPLEKSAATIECDGDACSLDDLIAALDGPTYGSANDGLYRYQGISDDGIISREWVDIYLGRAWRYLDDDGIVRQVDPETTCEVGVPDAGLVTRWEAAEMIFGGYGERELGKTEKLVDDAGGLYYCNTFGMRAE